MRIPKTHTLVERSYFYYIISKNHELEKENKRLQEKKQKVIALIKDGRFVEALKELGDK